MPAKPVWVKRREKEMADAGVTPELLAAAREEYALAGLDLSRCEGKGWRVFGIHPDQSRTYTLWHGLLHLVHDRKDIMWRYAEMLRESAE